MPASSQPILKFNIGEYRSGLKLWREKFSRVLSAPGIGGHEPRHGTPETCHPGVWRQDAYGARTSGPVIEVPALSGKSSGNNVVSESRSHWPVPARRVL